MPVDEQPPEEKIQSIGQCMVEQFNKGEAVNRRPLRLSGQGDTLLSYIASNKFNDGRVTYMNVILHYALNPSLLMDQGVMTTAESDQLYRIFNAVVVRMNERTNQPVGPGQRIINALTCHAAF